MSMKLYVGNLAFETTSDDLQSLFAQAGTVENVNVIEDRETGRSRGFGFVEMSTKEEGAAAIQQFNGKDKPYVLDISWQNPEGRTRFQRIPVGH